MPGFLERMLVIPSSMIGAGTLVLLSLVIVVDVTARGFGFALVGAAEIGGVLLAALIFLTVGYTQLQRGHVAIEAFVNYLPDEVRRVVQTIALTICLMLSIVLAYGTVIGVVKSYTEMEFQYGTMQFPLWPTKAIVAFGLVLLALEQAIQLVRDIGVVLGLRPPEKMDRLPDTTV